MSGKDTKILRGQLRQLVKEELGNVLSTEVIKSLEKKIFDHVNSTLSALHKQVEASLVQMDKKVGDGVSYLIRHTGQTPLKVKLNEDKQ